MIDTLKVKIFADGADLAGIRALAASPLVKGFTTNPTLMRKAGVDDYQAFAKQVLGIVGGRPVSFEVFADELRRHGALGAQDRHLGRQRRGQDPGHQHAPRILGAADRQAFRGQRLCQRHRDFDPRLGARRRRRAGAGDTGRDPVPIMRDALKIPETRPKAELLWASPREILNVFQADAIGCHIITVTADVLAKLKLIGKDLAEYSLETVKMFHDDDAKAGYDIDA